MTRDTKAGAIPFLTIPTWKRRKQHNEISPHYCRNRSDCACILGRDAFRCILGWNVHRRIVATNWNYCRISCYWFPRVYHRTRGTDTVPRINRAITLAFALLIVGAVLLISGIKDTQQQLYNLVKGDFTGPGNFFYWVLAILVIGAVGYIPSMRTLSRMFLILVLVVLLIHNSKNQGGLVQMLNGQLFGKEPQGATAQGTTAQTKVAGQ